MEKKNKDKSNPSSCDIDDMLGLSSNAAPAPPEPEGDKKDAKNSVEAGSKTGGQSGKNNTA